MSHVLLVMPQSSFLVDSRTFPPLGLLYLGAALEANGHKATVVDLAFNSPLEGHNPDLIGIMCLTPHFPQMRQLIGQLRSLYGDTPIVVGGPHFSTVPADGALVGADVTVVGDGEEQIVAIANGQWQKGSVMQSPGGIVDVNRFPIPARHLLPIAAYRYQIAGLTATTAITQRGCLVAGTKVMLSSGQQRPIELVQRGDSVVSFNPSTGRCEAAPVQDTWQREANDVWELTWANGQKLQVTAEHPIWTKRGWVEVGHLEKERDHVLMLNLPQGILRSKEPDGDSEVLLQEMPMGLAENSSQYPMDEGWAFETSSACFTNDGNGEVKVLGTPSRSNKARPADIVSNQEGQAQSDEAPRNSCKGIGYFEVPLGKKHVRIADSQMEIGTYALPMGSLYWADPEQIGAIAPRAIVGGGPHLPLRWHGRLLDRAMSIWKKAQSRLHRCGSKEGNTPAWGVLALTKSGLYRTEGLSWTRLDSPCSVVPPAQDQEQAAIAKETGLIWKELISKRFVGKRTVYNITVHPVHTYFANGIAVHNCPYECSFCCHWEGYRKVRLRHTDNVIAEIRQIKAMGFGAVQFYDDEYDLNHKRTIELCEAIKHEQIKWRAFIKANCFNEAQAKAFAESGCWELCTGVESGSDAILKTINKRATVQDNTRARELCRTYGIRFKAFAMVGHPGETRETAYATRDWLIANEVSEFNLSLFTPYLGTPNFDHPEKFDLQFDKLDYSQAEYFYRGKPGEYQSHARTSALSGEELARLRDEIEDEVREKLRLPKQGSSLAWNTQARPHDFCSTEIG